ncbi:zinc finger MYM-type protein 1-like [Hydra vulgaris]|uniref:zinc finger MYM-type protein 1-like n=1 Tax=Hydra vulgaris TaxID=6087 RepID=UPI001F5E85F9|nr:zinc finger MYM-type protein 1-like [Hydra vulgaris]
MSSGYDDWKHAARDLARHETSETHIKSIETLLTRRKAGEHISKRLTEQFESEKKYWNDILLRILSVIKMLASRGLSFRGSNEIVGSVYNGNYLGCVVLVADRDVLDHILTKIKEAKYFAVSVDSTPDISHVDQLTIIFRYMTSKGPVERFVTFIPIEEHTGEGLATKLLDFMENTGISIKDCRGQSYDNAANMSGRFNGMQAKIKEHNNLAEYIPCCAHSLNLDIMCQDMSQKPETQFEDAGLKDIMSHHETGILAQLWSKILKRFNLTSKYLQGTDMDLNTATELLRSLGDFVHSPRSQFTAFEMGLW